MNNSKTRPPIFGYPMLSLWSVKDKLWNCNLSGLFVLVGLSFLIQGAKAGTITLNDGGTTKLEVVARDGALGLANQIEDLFPASTPFDGSHVATQGASHSQAAYHFSQDVLSITSSGARAGLIDSRANVQPQIFFSVSADTSYSITGSLTVDDASSTGKYVEFLTTLKDVDTSEVLFHNHQATFGAVDQAFELGETDGVAVNELSGSSTGLLLGGHRYSLLYASSIYAANSGDSASFTGSFEMSFDEQTNPVPDSGASGILFALSLAVLGSLKWKITM